MKIASFHMGGAPEYGVVADDGIHAAPPEVLTRWPDLRAVLAADGLAAVAAVAGGQPALNPRTVVFDPVVPAPGRILCVGVNYLAHIREMGRERPDHPTLFVRFADTLVGHLQPLVRPAVSREYDYEGELAVVIGRSAYRVRAAEALSHVAGYTCFMDGSVRDWQRHTSQFIPGKNFPASGSMGPWLVTADELPDPARLTLETRVNGRVMQSAPISDLCIDVAHIVEYCSTFCRLAPGDVIATGTPSGVGFARTPPVWLAPGDVVEVAISGIGTLRNTVRDETC